MIAKDVLRDSRLSWKETGLLCYLLSLPDNWTLYIHELINHKQDGIKATRSGIKKLVTLGYLQKIVHRNSKKQIVKHEYIIHEKPLSQNLLVGKGTLLNTDSKYIDLSTGENRVQDLQNQYNEARWREITGAPPPAIR